MSDSSIIWLASSPPVPSGHLLTYCRLPAAGLSSAAPMPSSHVSSCPTSLIESLIVINYVLKPRVLVADQPEEGLISCNLA